MRWLCLLVLASAACGDNLEGDDRQGGALTVDDRTRDAFNHPGANLSMDELARFQAGKSPFLFMWEVPKLGPLFNNISCVGCHGGNGRGLSQIGDGPVSEALIRVSLDGTDEHGGPMPLPDYGTQLQDHATVGLPEVRVALTWIESSVMYGDGEVVSLREPRLDIKTPMGDYLPGNVHYSYRQAPPLIGLGLLDSIQADDIEALADPDDADGDGISGRVNRVWDAALGVTVDGRFGWKANAPDLHMQVAGAFAGDIGMTSYVFPEPDGSRDLNDQQLDDAVFFTSTIGVPAAAPRSGEALRGRTLFHELGCASCHVPSHMTAAGIFPPLGNQHIYPYTDLLLHDMGDRLTDARQDYLAQGVEWRTPPLWGIGLTQVVLPGATFLHDGRARTLEEAILWHGGEGEAAREAFRMASHADRAALIAFLDTL